MARRRGRSTSTGGKGRQVPDYYEGLPSDSKYKRTAHQRAVSRARSKWLIRLVVVAAIAGAVRIWGADVVRLAKLQARQTAGQVKAVGGGITEGRDRRSGVGFDENP